MGVELSDRGARGPFVSCEFIPEVVEAFPAAFEACEALLRFAVENRPSKPPTNDAAGRLVLRTYARSSKTYQASFLLAGRGYGVQAGMLNRSLFEDMLVAHWIKKNPIDAPKKYERHRRHSIELMREAMAKHGSEAEMAHLPPLSEKEREAYGEEFGYRSWTGLTTYDLTKAVEDEWPEGKLGRELLWWIYDIAQRFNNLLLHHSAIGLGLAAEEDTAEGVVRFDVGPSLAHVHGALLVAFFSYSQTMSLVLSKEKLEGELDPLYVKHLQRAFLRLRGDNNGAQEGLSAP